MAATRISINTFLTDLRAAYRRGDGYIMGATGQDPAKWAENSWWFMQYNGNARQKAKALYWRAHAARVWDCNGLAEGIYKDHTGASINTRARYNYSGWCGVRGSGLIPAARRVPGAAVFWGDTAAGIHHVAYLDAPVVAEHPEGDWYIIEARGVMYGVVRTRLNERKPNYWGWMDKYFDYAADAAAEPTRPHLGDRLLRNGCEGEDVRELQAALIELGHGCGPWGVDGDFGDATEIAVKAFQTAHGLEVDGVVGPLTAAALEAATAKKATAERAARTVEIVGGSCYVRSAPKVAAENALGVATAGTVLPYQGETSEDGWLLVEYKGKNGWVSGKYGRLSA